MRRYSTFLRLLDEDPAFREQVRQKILTRELLGLPALVAQVLDLQRQTLEVLRGFMEATERRFAVLEEDVRQLGDRVETLEGRVGRLTGRDFESQFRQMAPAIFRGGGDLRPALRRALSTLKEDLLSPKERLRLHKLDLLWGRGRSVFVGEVSETVGEDDVFRVRWSVEILGRLGWGRGLRLLPVVVGRSWQSLPEDLAWIRLDPDEELLEMSPGVEAVLREEGPEPVEPERFFGRREA
jgi:hypothetical protein